MYSFAMDERSLSHHSAQRSEVTSEMKKIYIYHIRNKMILQILLHHTVVLIMPMLSGLSIFVSIPVSTGYDMGVGMGSVSDPDPSYYNQTPHLVTSKVKMKT